MTGDYNVPAPLPLEVMSWAEFRDHARGAQIEYIEGLGDLAGPLPPPPPAGAGEIAFALKRLNEEVGFGTPPEAGAEALVSEATAILARG